MEECTAWGVCKATGAETAHCVCMSGNVAPWNRHQYCRNPQDTEKQGASHMSLWHKNALRFDFGTKWALEINNYRLNKESFVHLFFSRCIICELMSTPSTNHMSKKCSQKSWEKGVFVGVNCGQWRSACEVDHRSWPETCSSVVVTPSPEGWLCFLWTGSCQSRCHPLSSLKVPVRKHTRRAQFSYIKTNPILQSSSPTLHSHYVDKFTCASTWCLLQVYQQSGQSRHGNGICSHQQCHQQENIGQCRVYMLLLIQK